MPDLAETDPELLRKLRKAGRRWGPLGVALAAAHLVGTRIVIDHLTRRAPAEPERVLLGVVDGGTVHRLPPADEPDLPRMPHPRDRALGVAFAGDPTDEQSEAFYAGWDAGCRHVVETYEREQQNADEAQVDALRAEVARLSGLLDDAHRQLTHDPVDLRVEGPGLVTCSGASLRVVYDPDTAAASILAEHARRTPGPLDGDPRRPRLDSWPDDALTLTYHEVRMLIALHLDRCSSQPHLGQAMRDGEVPLRVAEVLDR